MDKLEYQAAVKFCKRRFISVWNSPKLTVYKQDSPSYSIVKKYAVKFKEGKESIKDDPHKGCPKSAAAPELVDRVHNMVSEDKKVKLRKIVKAVGISVECVGPILHNELHTKKLSARTVMTSSELQSNKLRCSTTKENAKTHMGAHLFVRSTWRSTLSTAHYALTVYGANCLFENQHGSRSIKESKQH